MKKNKKEKKIKVKKVMKLWEKVFVFGSVLIIVGFFALYLTRLIHYYRLENPEIDDSDKRLITAVLRDNKTVVKDDGLYEDDSKNYYFKGKNINNNYVYYSGRMWRIINIEKDTLTLITQDVQTSLVSDVKANYEKSYINNWLNNVFLKTLNDYENMIIKGSFCIDEIKLDSLTCENKYESYVGSIAVDDYLKAGGSESFLNNNTYFWTMNSSSDKKVWYVFDKGGVNDESKTEITYHSYGVRPVIKIKKDVNVYSGKGTEIEPYYLDDNTNTIISSKQVGSYVMFSGLKWKIQDKTDNYVKLIMDGYFKVKDKEIKVKYDNEDSMYNISSTLSKYLNGKVYNSLDKKSLKKCTFYIGSYGEDSKYNYKNVYKTKITSYVGVPSIGEMFINDYDKTWLSNNIDDVKLTAFTSLKESTLFADSITNSNYIRPVICIDNDLAVTSGTGLVNNPFVMGVLDETNN